MRADSPRWEQINPSAYPHEREGLRAPASYLPDADPYHVWANIEFVASDGSINELDALVLTRAACTCWSSSTGRGSCAATAASGCAARPRRPG